MKKKQKTFFKLKIGKIVSKTVQNRFGKVLLELGGNNAIIGALFICCSKVKF